MKRVILLAVFGCLVLAVGIQVFPEPAFAADDDGDGLDNDFELVLGTDPYSSDSDSDSVSDFDEVFVFGTNPLDPDTDCDGLADNLDPAPLSNAGNAGGQTTPTKKTG